MYEDFLVDPRIFCYGCGLLNTPKPLSCPKDRYSEPSISHQSASVLDVRGHCNAVFQNNSETTVLKRSASAAIINTDLAHYQSFQRN